MQVAEPNAAASAGAAGKKSLLSQQRYLVEFDEQGALRINPREGNFRVLEGSQVWLRLYEGQTPYAVQGCTYTGPSGRVGKLDWFEDAFGNKTFIFNAEEGGTYEFQLSPVYPEGSGDSPALTLERSGSKLQLERSSSQILEKTLEDYGEETDALIPRSYIIVEPLIRIRNHLLSPSQLKIQSVLPRCCGPLSEWNEAFETQRLCGFNCLHLTPVQTTGESGSCYSIANQLQVDPFFVKGDGKDASKASKTHLSLSVLRPYVEALEKEKGIIAATDLVLNHTASSSSWLRRHPEAAYTLETAPHLKAAFLLDVALQRFSRRLVNGEFFNEIGVSNSIEDEAALGRVMEALKRHCLDPFALSDFFRLDSDGCLEAWRSFLCLPEDMREAALQKERLVKRTDAQVSRELKTLPREARKERLVELTREKIGVSRLPFQLPLEYLSALYPSVHDEDCLREDLTEAAEAMRRESQHTYNQITGAIWGLAKYERLECRKGPLTLEPWNSLTPTYFTVFKRASPDSDANGVSLKEQVDQVASAEECNVLDDGLDIEFDFENNNDAFVACANNGWVMGWDATKDFAAPGALVYLQRQLVVWSDCVKLRYGRRPSDSPFLWSLMKRYCTESAKIFKVVRLDNCHSTPIHVAKFLLRCARQVRPSLWVFAELFTGSQEADFVFEKHLGINGLIREAMQTYSSEQLCHLLRQYACGEPVGALDPTCALLRLPTASVCKEDKTALSRVPLPKEAAMVGEEARRAALGVRTKGAGFASTLQSLTPRLCPALVFDCTHDNPTPAERMRPEAALALAAASVAGNNPCGSTRGTDEIIPLPLSVVTERRRYRRFVKKDLALEKDTEPTRHSDPTSETRVVWEGSCTSASVFGEWNNWSEGKNLSQENGVWVGSVPFDKHFKFVIDGMWMCSNFYPKQKDANGNENNILKKNRQQERHGEGMEAKGWKDDRRKISNFLFSLLSSHFSGDSGILRARASLNRIREDLFERGFNQMEVQELGEDALVITRFNPKTLESCYFILRTAYSRNAASQVALPEIQLRGMVVSTPLTCWLEVSDAPFQQNPSVINGLPAQTVFEESLESIASVVFDSSRNCTRISFNAFRVGGVAVVFTAPPASLADAVDRISSDLHATVSAVPFLLSSASPSSLNALLFRCAAEEQDVSEGRRSAYDIPGRGPLPFCGLSGVVAALDEVRLMGSQQSFHPFFQNMRSGLWLFEYQIARFHATPELKALAEKLEHLLFLFRQLKGFEVAWPALVDCVFSGIYSQIVPLILARLTTLASVGGELESPRKRFGANASLAVAASEGVRVFQAPRSILAAMQNGVEGSDPLLMLLLLACFQFYGNVPSASLVFGESKPSLCAGLPHFTTGFMRNWGRDTFIAFRGCLLDLGLFAECREELLAYMRVCRHGLIPNLLDGGNNPRFNARDATWFFLQALQDYCLYSPEGLAFLTTKVDFKFKAFLSPFADRLPAETVSDLIHHILQAHAIGIHFREWNAGRAIDDRMTDEGFNVDVTLDVSTGMIFGGNDFNCGTWMDKNGSSEKAGNKGIPATPRDGAAVEIMGLLKSTLRFVSSLPKEIFPYCSVVTPDGGECTYSRWNALLKNRFPVCFYVPEESEEKDSGASFFIDQTLVNRRGIIKDTYKQTRRWGDYQLRPNACIALAVAPELFSKKQARSYLRQVKEQLFGGEDQLGLKTLDPTDLNFRPNYNNGDDSDDKAVAHGYNYHQGPEWVWPLGFFLEACGIFEFVPEQEGLCESPPEANTESRLVKVRRHIMRCLRKHRSHMQKDPWRSLPELTNENGRKV